MDTILSNPGLILIVRHISSYLNAKSLAQCRLVSKPWKDLTDNHRHWLSLQLEHIKFKTKLFVDYQKKGEPNILSNMAERFPEWNVVIEQFSRRQNNPREKEFVRQM